MVADIHQIKTASYHVLSHSDDTLGAIDFNKDNKVSMHPITRRSILDQLSQLYDATSKRLTIHSHGPVVDGKVPEPLSFRDPQMELWMAQRRGDVLKNYTVTDPATGDQVSCGNPNKSSAVRIACNNRVRQVMRTEWKSNGNTLVLPRGGEKIKCSEQPEVCEEEMKRRYRAEGIPED